jgi:hypothetical protein
MDEQAWKRACFPLGPGQGTSQFLLADTRITRKEARDLGTEDLSECPKIETRWVRADSATECQGCTSHQLHPSKFSCCHRLPQNSLSGGTVLPPLAPLDAKTVGSMAFHASIIPVLRYIRPKRALLIRSLLRLSFKSSAYER